MTSYLRDVIWKEVREKSLTSEVSNLTRNENSIL